VNRKIFRNVTQTELMDWAAKSGVQFDYAVTQTFPDDVQKIETARRRFTKFRDRLDRMLFGNQFRRKGRCVAMIPFTHHNGKLHYHVSMQRPAHISPSDFEEAIRQCWHAVHKFAPFVIVDIRPMYSLGWVGYSGKEASERSTEAIDAENVSFGTRKR